MLFYGDRQVGARTAERIERLLGFVRELRTTGDSESVRSLLRSALVEAGELSQGVHDQMLAAGGGDGGSPAGRLADSVTLAFTRALEAAHRGAAVPPVDPAPLVALTARPDLPETISVRVPEGFAFYAVMPEVFLEAGRRLRAEWSGALVVLGIRSIGTALGAAVAAGAGGEAELRTVRPGGHPFDRRVVFDEPFARHVRELAGRARFAIVDEGPGLSGSSFAAVADALGSCDVAADRIAFFPAHPGAPGPRATEKNRGRWASSERFFVSFEEAFLSGKPSPLEHAVEDLTGPWEGIARDVGAGGWRDVAIGPRECWPAVAAGQERRKYLVSAGGEPWLLKFAGLGRFGAEKLALCRALERERFVLPVAGIRAGFLVRKWRPEMRPASVVPDLDRAALVNAVARYAAFRRTSSAFAAGETRGASPEALLEMAIFNTREALGPSTAEALRAWRSRIPELTGSAAPVRTDNRMQIWKWLVGPDGRFVKTDAFDHHASHDLVGAQDIAWDLAGAAVELGLSEAEEDRLLDGFERAGGSRPRAGTLAFYRACYLAFELARNVLAAQAAEASDREESDRLRRAAARYAAEVRRIMGGQVPSCSQ